MLHRYQTVLQHPARNSPDWQLTDQSLSLHQHQGISAKVKYWLHLTNRNIKRYPKFNGSAFISDAYQNIKNKYNVIITNPPIRVGKTKLLEILEGAFDHLEDNGILYFVIRKDQGALSIKKILEEQRQEEIINKDKGYFIFKVK